MIWAQVLDSILNVRSFSFLQALEPFLSLRGASSPLGNMVFRPLWFFTQTSWKRWAWFRPQSALVLSILWRKSITLYRMRPHFHGVVQQAPHPQAPAPFSSLISSSSFPAFVLKSWQEPHCRILETPGWGVQNLASREGLPNRTFCSEGNGPYLGCSAWEPLTLCGFWAFKMWLMGLQNRILNFI